MTNARMKVPALLAFLLAFGLCVLPHAAFAQESLTVGSAATVGKTATVGTAKAVKAGEQATAPSVKYRVKLEDLQWQPWVADSAKAGKAFDGKRILALRVDLDPGELGGSIYCRVRTASGWQPWCKDGELKGLYSDIEGIQIKLTGGISKQYDVVYRTCVMGIGWQARVRNGATAGTAKGYGIEDLRIHLVKKSNRSGWVGSGTTWSYYKKGKKLKNTWLETIESPINVMTAEKTKYWLDGNGRLAVKRIINPDVARDKGAGHAYYANGWGVVMCNVKLKTAKGIVLALGDGSFVSRPGWYNTLRFDDQVQRYYMASVGSYAVCKTGFFRVGKKAYYGYPNRGYIMRDMTIKQNGKWYSADPSGSVGRATSAQKHIERYVRWAVNIANDDSHGYSQDGSLRWGPDYDCSSLVISSLKKTGLSAGAAIYTGNMKSELTARGFRWHTDMSKIRRGDILLVHSPRRQHTEIYLGSGLTVGAHIAETGGIFGKIGDQTGHEIDVGPYYNIWQGYLRFGS